MVLGRKLAQGAARRRPRRGRDRRLAVFRNGERAWAVDAACPHEGNPLVEGELLGTTLVCAFHGWRFDLETGACLWGEEPVRRYPAEVRDGEVWVQTS